MDKHVPNHLEFRFLVTNKCNYGCVFCHEEGIHNARDNVLTAPDYRFLFKTTKDAFGWNSASLSGGEPLFRKDITQIARELWEEGAKITLITNGALLAARSDIGKYISRVNISVHTTDADKYEKLIARKHPLERTFRSINTFMDMNPNVDLRFNATIVQGTNAEKQDIMNLVKMTKDMNGSIKLLELFPPTDPAFVPIAQVEDILCENGFTSAGAEFRSKKFSAQDLWVMTSKCVCAQALDKADPSEFCRVTSDLFLSPDGKVKPCRLDSSEFDLLPAIQSRDALGVLRHIRPILIDANPKCPSLLSQIRGKKYIKLMSVA